MLCLSEESHLTFVMEPKAESQGGRFPGGGERDPGLLDEPA